MIQTEPDMRDDQRYAHLISDMQSFKAANPEAEFIDFVRWHSPKDFVDGKLSERMGVDNNLWKKIWDTCRPLPMVLQKPLFDSGMEAERALFWLENAPLASFLEA